MEKPICLRLEDARGDIAAAINRALDDGIPYYLIEPIMKDFYTQTMQGKAREVLAIRQDYERRKNDNADESGVDEHGD